ncbi:MAG TPA: helix-turn-helix domain-containing protein [Acidimicrobiales bacterium]|nr:helix-turn-helix domain-containing protein [Acidimicrobiales bacterium]
MPQAADETAPAPTPPAPTAGPDDERRQLMDAALKVMRRNGFLGASVQDILDHAGLSTRAFYRQFQSKDDLLLAMFRTAATPDVEQVARQVAAAPSPAAAVRVWVDEILEIAYDRKRIQRMVMFNAVARQTVGYDDEVAWLEDHLVAPLLDALRAGAADGSLPGADPLPDAYSIFDLVWSVASPQVRQRRPMGRDEACEHVLRFCLPALGAVR